MDIKKELAEVALIHKYIKLKTKNPSNALAVTEYLTSVLKKNPTSSNYLKILRGVLRSLRDDFSVGLISDEAYTALVRYIDGAQKRC